MKLSDRIKKFRKDNNLTQSDFAGMLYVSKQAVSKWENERGIPDVSLYPDLARILNVSVDELMGIEKEQIDVKSFRITKKIIYLGIGILLFVASIITFYATKDLRKQFYLRVHTQNYLQEVIPDIESYDYLSLSSMSVMNHWYPETIYYFIFEENKKLASFEQSIENSNEWVDEISAETYESLPSYLQPYCETCDLFLIINYKDNYFAFIAYQKELNRLIISEYETR